MPFKIICFGEILFDVFKEKEVLGGAPFNFGFHLHKLNQKVDFLTKIGQDEYGSRILNFFEEQNLSKRLLQTDPLHPTGSVEVTIDDNGKPEYIIHLDVAWDFIEYNSLVDSVAKDQPDLIYFGSLAQRHEHSRKTLHKLMKAKHDNTKTFCDVNLRQNFYSKDLIKDALVQSSIVKVNDEEFEQFKEMFKLKRHENEAAKKLIDQYLIDFLCITKGEKGSSIYTPSRTFHWENPHTKIKIIDTVGAGDAFSSILIYGILNDWDLEKVLSQASQFAQKICTIPGAIPDNNLFYSMFKETI